MIEKSQYLITCLHYEPEHDNADRGECLWADFSIDAFHNVLTIRSDCGNLQYQWNKIGNESFPIFLAGISREYFLRKLSEKTVFDFDKTIQNLLSYVDINTRPNYYHFIKTIPTCTSENQFIPKLMSHLDSHFDDLECIIRDYPFSHQKLADIFVQYIQPELYRI